MKSTSHRIMLVMTLWMVISAILTAQISSAKVTGGRIEGVVKNGVASFKGIPFAAPPVGRLRWKAPQPVKPWKGVKKADAFAPIPMQDTGMAALLGTQPDSMSEDCLYLNVWTAAQKSDEKRPVMVWVSGNGFAAQNTSAPLYDGYKFAYKGVVLVSIAYRVGPFGFLAHPELSREGRGSSGCYGLLDQIAALRWVKENIAQFGGDPANVTLFGASAGADSAALLTCSPIAAGLFNRVICESPRMLGPLKTKQEDGPSLHSLSVAETKGKDFLHRLGVDGLKKARALDAKKLRDAANPTGEFWPCLDGAVIAETFFQCVEQAHANEVAVVIGTNSDEGALFVRPGVKAVDFEKQIREGYGPAAEELLKVYPHASDEEAYQSTKAFFRDSQFAWPAWSWANLLARAGKSRVFVYFFDQHSPLSPNGAMHGAEIPYVFKNFAGTVLSPKIEDYALGELMNTFWINFAKTGDPNQSGLPEWPTYDEKDKKAFCFGGGHRARPLPNQDKLKALDAYGAGRRESSR